MRDEMKRFFKKMFELFVFVGVKFLPTLVAEFSYELVAAVFANNVGGHG